jgi:hypothetical protein
LTNCDLRLKKRSTNYRKTHKLEFIKTKKKLL